MERFSSCHGLAGHGNTEVGLCAEQESEVTAQALSSIGILRIVQDQHWATSKNYHTPHHRQAYMFDS